MPKAKVGIAPPAKDTEPDAACVMLQAKVKGKIGQPQLAEYDLDALGRQKEMSLPTMDSMG